MKKLLALAVLSTASFAAPCFGVDFLGIESTLPHHTALVMLVML